MEIGGFQEMFDSLLPELSNEFLLELLQNPDDWE